MTEYAISIADPLGVELLRTDQFISLSYVRNLVDVGRLSLQVDPSLDYDLFRKHGRIGIYRKPIGGGWAPDTETVWFITGKSREESESGERRLTIRACSANWLITGRIVAYAAASAYADKSDLIDDMMKAIVRENLGALATDANRDWSALLSVQADLSLGPSADKKFSWRKAGDVLKDLQDASVKLASPVYYDIVAPTIDTLEFRTYSQYRGVDHTLTSGLDPVLVSMEAGSLSEVYLSEDWDEEVTYGYAGGQGEEAARVVRTASDAVHIAESPFGRREAFRNAVNVAPTDTATLDDEAASEVRAGKPKRRFRGTLSDTPACRYGVDWNWGDLVTAEAFGYRFDCAVQSVDVTVADGKETIKTNLEYED